MNLLVIGGTRFMGAAVARAARWRGEIVVAAPAEGSASPPGSVDHRQHLVLATERVRRELGYHEVVGLEQALESAVRSELAAPPSAEEVM